ncbi:MAG: RNA methyltransferase [Chlamydiia bacterium]|nr:RNA methyltransferase [Chlamydiia bacterium]
MALTRLTHPLVKHLVKLRQNKKYRQEQQRLLIEGKTLLKELPVKPLTILSCESPPFPHTTTTPEVIQKIAGTQHPEGTVAEVPFPDLLFPKNPKRLLILDAIRDPGNLGNLLRTALAFNWDGVLLLPGTCDPFNDKALRASRAAPFHLPIKQATWDTLPDIPCYLADLTGTPLTACHPTSPFALLLSNEASGPSQTALKTCIPITIPMPGPTESLNVATAGAILLHHFSIAR